jgi:hypothetical protein
LKADLLLLLNDLINYTLKFSQSQPSTLDEAKENADRISIVLGDMVKNLLLYEKAFALF